MRTLALSCNRSLAALAVALTVLSSTGAAAAGYLPKEPTKARRPRVLHPGANLAVAQRPSAPASSSASSRASSTTGTPWLKTEGNRILTEDGEPFRGRGANVQDTRGCNACSNQPPDADEVIRRIDELTDVWGANFIRLTLESGGSPSVLTDPDYLADIERIVDHVGEKPGVYVLLSLWHDPTFTSMGWPSAETHPVWEQLAHTFAEDSHVLFGLVNEPQDNYDGALNEEVWQAMNDTVEAIRAVEAEYGERRHIITVQGTGGWARHLSYYVDNPITAGGGEDIAYEVHVYDPATAFDDMFVKPAEEIPVIIGEFGPMHSMSMQDSATLMEVAEANDIPYLAWTFHMRCPPNLIEDFSNGGCGVDMPLEPSDWGRLFMERLAQPWGE